MPGAQISGLTVRQKSRGILRCVEQDLSRRQECTVGEESMARKLRMWLALLFMAGSIKGDVKSKHISRTDLRAVLGIEPWWGSADCRYGPGLRLRTFRFWFCQS